MSDYYSPSPQAPSTPPSQDSPSMTDKASDAANQGKEAAGQVAQTAVEHAQEVKDEATRQARDLAGEARQQLGAQVGEQHGKLVGSIRSLSSELGSMADNSTGQAGVATELVGQARDRLDGIAEWLDGRDPSEILDDVRSYARRRPGMFLLGALAAGVVAGRVTRGAVAAHTSDDGSASNGSAGTQPDLAGSTYGTESFASAPETGYSSGGHYGQPGAGAQPPVTQGYGSTSTYGDGSGAQYGEPQVGLPYGAQPPVQPTQNLPAEGTWR
jgi:hypothetical protein